LNSSPKRKFFGVLEDVMWNGKTPKANEIPHFSEILSKEDTKTKIVYLQTFAFDFIMKFFYRNEAKANTLEIKIAWK
jgi:hypothetical protein